MDKFITENNEVIGVYHYDADFGRWYVNRASGKRPFKCVSFKTEKGAISYIKRQAEKYISVTKAIKERYSI